MLAIPQGVRAGARRMPRLTTIWRALACDLSGENRFRDGKDRPSRMRPRRAKSPNGKSPISSAGFERSWRRMGQFDRGDSSCSPSAVEAGEPVTQWLFDHHSRAGSAPGPAQQAAAGADCPRREDRSHAQGSAAGLVPNGHRPREQAHRTDEATVRCENAIARAKDILGKEHAAGGHGCWAGLGDVLFQDTKNLKPASGLFHRGNRHLPSTPCPVATRALRTRINNLAASLLDVRGARGRGNSTCSGPIWHVREASAWEPSQSTYAAFVARYLGLAYRSTHHPKEAISTLETWLKTDPRPRPEQWPRLPLVLGGYSAAAMRHFINSIRPRHVTCALFGSCGGSAE